MQQRINCLKKLFEIKLNQTINYLDNSNRAKLQKKSIRKIDYVTKAN